MAPPFSFHLTLSSLQRTSCVRRLQSSRPSLVPRQAGIQPDLKGQIKERFAQIFTMSLKPPGQGTLGCLKPVGKGDTGPPTLVQEATAEEDQRVLTALGSGQAPLPSLRASSVCTQKMSNLFFHQRMIFQLPDKPPSSTVCPLSGIYIGCYSRRLCRRGLIWRQKASVPDLDVFTQKK